MAKYKILLKLKYSAQKGYTSALYIDKFYCFYFRSQFLLFWTRKYYMRKYSWMVQVIVILYLYSPHDQHVSFLGVEGFRFANLDMVYNVAMQSYSNGESE